MIPLTSIYITTALFQWVEEFGEHFCDGPKELRICVYQPPSSPRWHFCTWRDGQDGYLHDSNNIEDRSGFDSLDAAKCAAVKWGKCPVINPRRKVS